MSEPVKIRQGEDAGAAKMERPANTSEAGSTVLPPETPVAAAKNKRSRVRGLLFAALPIALVVGGYYYVTGGQLVSVDNAYVQARIAGVSTDVAGTVKSIAVHDNEKVTAVRCSIRSTRQATGSPLTAPRPRSMRPATIS